MFSVYLLRGRNVSTTCTLKVFYLRKPLGQLSFERHKTFETKHKLLIT